MLSIAAVVQNEAKWLPEWIEYHALPSIGVEAFLLYDDGSSDGTERVLQRYHAAGLVWPFTTEQMRPFKNTTLIKPHTRVIIPLFKRLPGPPPYSHWCIRVEPFPQQIAMMRHAANTAATRWIAFNDVDEFVVSMNPMPLAAWLSVLPRDVGGVAMQPHIMMTERTAPSLLHETERMEVAVELLLNQKVVVRRADVHPVTVSMVHEVALREGQRYVRDASVSIAHFRYRDFQARQWKRYLVPNATDPRVNRLKQLNVQTMAHDLREARLRNAFTHYVSLLPHAHRVEAALAARDGVPVPRTHAGVVIVSEARSGSSWFAQRVFGAHDDVLYLYEPCRANARVGDAGTWFDDDCVWLVRQLLDCALPYAYFGLLKRDKWSVRMSSPGAFRSYRFFMRMCAERHVVIKTVRIFDPAPLPSARTLVVHLERDADAVLASRRRRKLEVLGVREGQERKRRAANVTVRLDEAAADPEGVALRLHAQAGIPVLSGLVCDPPPADGWLACASAS
jgi:hypothetical protein